MDENHDLKSNLIRKRNPHLDAINRYIFNCNVDQLANLQSVTLQYFVPLTSVWRCNETPMEILNPIVMEASY